MLFAHLKRILRLGRLRLHGPSRTKDEFLLVACFGQIGKDLGISSDRDSDDGGEDGRESRRR
jgi:hypothetical protein